MQRSLIVVFFSLFSLHFNRNDRKNIYYLNKHQYIFFSIYFDVWKGWFGRMQNVRALKKYTNWIYLRKLCTKIEWDCLLEILKNILLNKIPVHGDKGSSGYSVALACGKRRLNVAVPWMRPQNLRSLACDSQTCKGNWKLSRHLHRYEQIILKWDRNFTLRLNEIAF